MESPDSRFGLRKQERFGGCAGSGVADSVGEKGDGWLTIGTRGRRSRRTPDSASERRIWSRRLRRRRRGGTTVGGDARESTLYGGHRAHGAYPWSYPVSGRYQ